MQDKEKSVNSTTYCYRIPSLGCKYIVLLIINVTKCSSIFYPLIQIDLRSGRCRNWVNLKFANQEGGHLEWCGSLLLWYLQDKKCCLSNLKGDGLVFLVNRHETLEYFTVTHHDCRVFIGFNYLHIRACSFTGEFLQAIYLLRSHPDFSGLWKKQKITGCDLFVCQVFSHST